MNAEKILKLFFAWKMNFCTTSKQYLFPKLEYLPSNYLKK